MLPNLPDKSYAYLFIKFCLWANIFDDMTIEFQRKQVTKDNFIGWLRKKDGYDLFNQLLGWSLTINGWNFWANVSVLWKLFLDEHNALPNDYRQPLFWEVRMTTDFSKSVHFKEQYIHFQRQNRLKKWYLEL